MKLYEIFSKLQYFLTCKRIINLRLFADEYKYQYINRKKICLGQKNIRGLVKIRFSQDGNLTYVILIKYAWFRLQKLVIALVDHFVVSLFAVKIKRLHK